MEDDILGSFNFDSVPEEVGKEVDATMEKSKLESGPSPYDDMSPTETLVYLYMYYAISQNKIETEENKLLFDYSDFYTFVSELTAYSLDEFIQKYDLHAVADLVKKAKEIVDDVNILENPHESFKSTVAKVYSRLTSFYLRPVIVNLPITYSVTQAVKKIRTSGTLVKLRGLVRAVKPPYFFEEAVKVVCDGMITLETYRGDFWDNIPASKKINTKELRKLAEEKGCEQIQLKPYEIKVLEIEVVDLPEDAEGGSPASVIVYALGDDVWFNAGDQIELIAVVRGKKRGNIKELVLQYEYHRELKKEENLVVDWNVVNKLKHMPFPHNFMSLLASFGAPVYGWWVTKAFLLASAVLKPELSEYATNKVIDPLPILLVGDPQVGKTSLANLATQYVKPSVRVKSTGITPAGLILSAEKTEGGRWIYKPGLLLQYKGGLIVIEELSRNPQIADDLLLPIETGEVTRSTAGGTINIRTNVWALFVTNPAGGVWNDGLGLKDNLSFLSDAFLTRVSVHVMRKPVEKRVAKLVSKVMFLDKKSLYRGLPFTPDEVKMLIQYLRTLPNPRLSPEALEVLVSYAEEKGEEVIGPRDEINIIRLAKGIAKIDFKDEVLPEHMKFAIMLEEQRRMMNYGGYVDDISKIAGPTTSQALLERITEEVYKIVKAKCEVERKGVTPTEVLYELRETNPKLHDMIMDIASQMGESNVQLMRKILAKLVEENKLVLVDMGRKKAYCDAPVSDPF